VPVRELRERYERQARGRSPDGSQRWFNWIVREAATSVAVGYVQATEDVESRAAEIAWVIGSRHQRRGYAREAAAAMVEWLRGTGVSVVTARIDPDHAASAAVARAVGLVPTTAVVAGEVTWRG
jgi:RimJ/RimL family protein N-acetyltransferase